MWRVILFLFAPVLIGAVVVTILFMNHQIGWAIGAGVVAGAIEVFLLWGMSQLTI